VLTLQSASGHGIPKSLPSTEAGDAREHINEHEFAKVLCSLYKRLVNFSVSHYVAKMGSDVGRGTIPHPSYVLPLSNMLPGLFRDHIGLLVSLLAVVLAVRYLRSPWRSVPLGPRGLPILGNALQLKDKTWMFRRDCKDAYSVFSFDI